MPKTTNETPEEVGSSFNPEVPVMAAADVQRLMKELQEAQARAADAEKKLHKFDRVSLNAHPAEPAQDYVVADDTVSFPQLNELNSAAVVADAQRQGKDWALRSHVTHRNAVPHDPRGGAAATFWMYDDGGYARRVQRQSISSAVAAGLHPVCPKCQGWHKESETNPNVCPNRKPVKFTVCQYCQANGYYRPIYDLQESRVLNDAGEEVGATSPVGDPNYTAVQAANGSTPEARLQVQLEDHIRAYHKATAASMKLASGADI